MPIVVNSNTTATTASFNLSHANDALRKSLARLSSGKRIVNPADDAGGMAVAYKLESALKRTEAVRQNVQNGISYLQVQDGALAITGKILSRMAEFAPWHPISQKIPRILKIIPRNSWNCRASLIRLRDSSSMELAFLL